MKKLLLLLAFILLPQIVSAQVVPTGHWPFDGNDVVGGRILDISGNGNFGKPSGIASSTFYRPGKIGQGLNFDGGDDYISVGSSVSAMNISGVMTISAWINTNTITGSAPKDIISNADAAGNNIEWLLELNRNAGGKFGFIHGGSGGAYCDLTNVSTTAIGTKKWYHIAVTRTGSAGSWTITFYLNGVQDGTYNCSVDPQPNAVTEIGRAGGAQLWNGMIDDVRVYNRALTATQISQLYNSKHLVDLTPPSVTNNLVGWWTMDGKDTPNGVAIDRSGSNNTGNLISIASSTFFKAGKIGQSYNFDGTNDEVLLPNVSTYNFSNANNFSLVAWVNPSISSANNVVFNKQDAGGNGGYTLTVSSSNELIMRVRDAVGAADVSSNTNIVLPNKWSHVVAVFKGPTSVSFYVNGVFQGAGTFARSLASVSGTADIGKNANTSAFFTGQIDDMRIYNTNISTSTIQQLYNGGLDVSLTPQSFTNGLTGWWTFDGTNMTGGRAIDRIANASAYATAIATSTLYRPGRIGQGLRFDGVDDHFDTVAVISTVMSASTGSISAWVYPTAASSVVTDCTNGGSGNIFSDSFTGGGGNLWIGWDSGRHLCFGAYDGGTNRNYLSAVLPLNQWYHVVWVHSNGALQGWVNGQFVVAGLAPALGAINERFSFGWGYTHASFFPGIIDEMRTYSTALSTTTIQQLYNNGTAVTNQ